MFFMPRLLRFIIRRSNYAFDEPDIAADEQRIAQPVNLHEQFRRRAVDGADQPYHQRYPEKLYVSGTLH
jgi:hypothetical protein